MARVVVLTGSADLAWRLVFLTGIVPAAIALWIRRRIREPETWTAERGAVPRLAELFAPELRRATLGALALCLVTLVTWWGVTAFLPFVAASFAPAGGVVDVAAQIRRATNAFNLGGLVGTIATIPLARLGRRRLFALYFLGAALAIWTTFGLAWEPATRIRLLFLVGLTVFGVNGAYSFYLPELFPIRLRGTGAGFCFNTGRLVAAAGPYLVGAALGSVATPMDAIRWVAIVPLVGLAVVPTIVETAPCR